MSRKKKTSVTLDNSVLEWIEKEIRSKRFRSVSHAVEFALYKLIQQEKEKG